MTLAMSARDLRVRYGARTVLRGVSMDARFGEITAILGPNGAGKSTLLRALLGLCPCEGEVLWEGAPLTTLSRAERARRVAYVPQRSSLDAAVSVKEVVLQGRYAHRDPFRAPGATDWRAVDLALERCDVAALAQRPFTKLSGGEQRRVLVARALATEARTLLLDEPTESLDVGHVLSLHALLRELAAEGRAIVTVLHGLDAARRYTDSAVLLADGAFVQQGPTREIVAEGPIRDVYAVDLVEAGALGFRRIQVAP